MAITIVTTVSGASSNSYATLAYVDAYIEGVPWFYATWAAVAEATRKQWVVMAARAIDRWRYRGVRYDKDQAMEFPRTITDDQTDEGDMPDAVKRAQCEMIVWLYNHLATDDGSPENEVSKVSIGRGALSVEFKEFGKKLNREAGGYPEAVRALLREWVMSDGTVELLRG